MTTIVRYSQAAQAFRSLLSVEEQEVFNECIMRIIANQIQPTIITTMLPIVLFKASVGSFIFIYRKSTDESNVIFEIATVQRR